MRKKAYEAIITMLCDRYGKGVGTRKRSATERPLVSPV